MPSQTEDAQDLIQELIDACDARMARIPDAVPQLRKESARYQVFQAALHISPNHPDTPKLAEKVLRELSGRLEQLRGPVTW